MQDKNQRTTTKKVAIVGAGVSGLAAAYKLKSHGVSVTVFESEGRVGGKLKSESSNGIVWDDGANTMTASEVETQNLIESVGLVEKQQFPLSQHKRYIVRNGVPVLIPGNPIELIGSNILSLQGKLQLVLEPFLWKKRASSKISDSTSHESVGMFFQRHFGKEIVDYLIDPFVAGTTGADPESLSALHSFPSLWDIETRFGSLISGAIMAKLSSKSEKGSTSNVSKEKRKRQRGSFSFVGGMQTLAETLGSKLETTELKLHSKVLSLSYNLDEKSPLNWSVSYTSKGSSHMKSSSYDAILVTAPISDVKQINFSKNRISFPLNFLPEVVYMPLSVIITAFRKEKVKKPLEGFGVLVPSKEQQNGFQTLGTLFSSSMFPDRAPNDLYLYTTFVGGSRNMELAKAASEKLKDVVSSDLRQLLSAEGEPVFFRHFYWSKAFPLYGKDYGAVLEGIEKMEKNLPGLFYAGNHRDGLAVGKVVASGCKAADLVMSYLEAQSNLLL